MALKRRLGLGLCLAGLAGLAACSGFSDQGAMGWDPPDTETSSGGTSGDPSDSAGDESTTGDSGEDDSTGLIDPTGDGESTGGGSSFDCSAPWSPAFVGSPCADDGDCGFEGGRCILEDEGFPCGTCSVSCDGLCPDQDGAPETFCIDTVDVELEDTGGTCLSRCDPTILGGNGCRDGYACSVLDRFGEPATSTGTCIPIALAGGGADTDCQETLLELGAVFTPIDHPPESPAGYPNLTCDIEDPVLLYGPINGVAIQGGTGSDAPVLVGCETAVSLVGSAAVAQNLGAVTIIHYGTYNCRTIAGSDTLSEHGHARAVDIGGFVMNDGSTYSVYGDWEDGNPNPTTPPGVMLRAFTDRIWGMGLWNIILTPEFNADHDDHFHVDLKPGGNTYD